MYFQTCLRERVAKHAHRKNNTFTHSHHSFSFSSSLVPHVPSPSCLIFLLPRALTSSYLTSGISSVASMLPTAVTEVWTQARSFAQVQLPTPVANLAALVDDEGEMPVLLIVTEEGYLCMFLQWASEVIFVCFETWQM